MTDTTPSLPIPIARLGTRYLLHSIEAITYLRRHHNICGVLIGTLPQSRQQNVFLGLPLELLPEEARLLVEKGVAYIVDDVTAHKTGMLGMGEEERTALLKLMEMQGRKAKMESVEVSGKRKEKALREVALKKSKAKKNVTVGEARSAESSSPKAEEPDEEESLFNNSTPRSQSPVPLQASTLASESRFHITPTTSTPPLDPSTMPKYSELPHVPVSYPLFACLHEHGYFISPGLRFGCQYVAYPGDPLRYHSHFLAVGLDWDEEIDLLDIVGGGRLGTGVKKGFLLGGKQLAENAGDLEDSGEGNVRTFCIEWSAM